MYFNGDSTSTLDVGMTSHGRSYCLGLKLLTDIIA